MSLNKFLKKISKNADARVLIENFASLTFLKIAGYIFPLITLPYLARVIGVDKFGEIAFAASVIVYFQTIIDFGFNYTAVKEIARNKKDKDRVSGIFSTIMGARVLLMLLSFGILLLCIQLFTLFFENRLILLLTFLYIPGMLIFPEWFFQAMEKMKYITLMNLFSRMIFTLFVFLFIKEKEDYILQPVLFSAGYIVSGIISVFIIVKKFGVKFRFPRIREIYSALSESWDMFVSLFLPNLYTNFSVVLLRIYGGEVATGIYSAGFRFIDFVNEISGVLSRTFYPFLARRIDKHTLYVRISGGISIITSLCLFLSADILVKIFYTSEFSSAATVIRIMAISPFFLFLMSTYGHNYLVLIDKMKVFRNIVMCCSVLGFGLSWFFVASYSYTGVAVTITLVWAIRGLITFIYAQKYKKGSHLFAPGF